MSLLVAPAWATISALLLAVPAAALSWQLIRQPLNSARRWLVLVVQWLGAVSLWLLLVQPQRVDNVARPVVLLTPGSSAVEGTGVVRLSGLDLYPLLKEVPRADLIEVRGHGLPLEQWRGTDASLSFNPATLPAGLLDVDWPQRLILGQPLTVSARAHRLLQAREAVLLAPGDVEIQRTSIGRDGRFSLSMLPPTSGSMVLHLALRDSTGGTVLREPLPVLIEEPAGPRVLLALENLSFEARDLQRWLARSTPGLRLEAQVGARVRRTLTSGESPALDAWQREPDALDLMVVDSAWLAGLGAVEGARLARAVVGGMGLLVLGDDRLLSLATSPLLDTFALEAADGGATRLSFEGGAAELERVAVTGAGGRAIVSATDASPLVLSRSLGAGSVVVSLLRNSYSLNTRGQETAYASLWREVVSTAARPLPAEEWITSPLPVMRVGERVARCDASRCRAGALQNAGWNDLDGLRQFAFSDDNWSAYRAQLLQEQTKLAVALRGAAGNPGAGRAPWIPLGVLWLTFVLSAGLLWLEQKFRT
ncbi:MAG: hypothetical protein AAF358_06360 [Pseudomonadota bacterium]